MPQGKRIIQFGFYIVLAGLSGCYSAIYRAANTHRFEPRHVQPAFVEFYQYKDEVSFVKTSAEDFVWTILIKMPNGKMKTINTKIMGGTIPMTLVSVEPGRQEMTVRLGSYAKTFTFDAKAGRTTLIALDVKNMGSHSSGYNEVTYSFMAGAEIDGDFPRVNGTANKDYSALVEFLVDGRIGVRAYAAKEIGASENKDALPSLEAALQNEPNPAVKKYIQAAIKRVRNPGAYHRKIFFKNIF